MVVDISELTFEDAFQRLEETVTLLEGGELTIDEMIERFEEGIALVTHCRRRLDNAQARVTVLAREVDEYVDLDVEDDGDLSG